MKDFSSEKLSVDLGCFVSKLSNLKPSEVDKKFNINEITDYVESILLNMNSNILQVVTLPSLDALANCYNCSYLDIHDVFRLLRERGFEYEFKHTNEPMKVWKHINIVANVKGN